jgi:diguanylate cyclase (GGDEF)-like protein/PAS domain S-box-containing protein
MLFAILQSAMEFPSLQESRMKVQVLEKESHLQQSILEAIRYPFFVVSRKGEFLQANPKGMEMLGYSWDELQKMVFIDVVALDDLSRIKEKFEEMERGEVVQLRIRIVSGSGVRIPAEFCGTLREENFFITLSDLREKIEAEEELERTKKELLEKIREKDQYARELQAMRDLFKEKAKEIEKMREEAVRLSYTDDLTGIYNHRFFIQQLTMEVERQKRYPSPLSLLMIDIDYFKHYNDTNGHLAGDQVLRAISILIQRGVRQTDIAARYGGEEFSAILINTNKEKAMEIAERVRRSVAETHFPNEIAQPNGDLTVSIGVATFSPFISTLTGLIRQADHSLYRAKRAGRNRVEG